MLIQGFDVLCVEVASSQFDSAQSTHNPLEEDVEKVNQFLRVLLLDVSCNGDNLFSSHRMNAIVFSLKIIKESIINNKTTTTTTRLYFFSYGSIDLLWKKQDHPVEIIDFFTPKNLGQGVGHRW